jgi:hypothetical protein
MDGKHLIHGAIYFLAFCFSLFPVSYQLLSSQLLASRFSTSQRVPFVDGNSLFEESFFTAILMDLAKALKMASILWCSFCPSALIFRLHLAVSEKDLKKWKNSSVGTYPIRSRLNSASQTSHGRPPKSIAT